MHTVLLALLVIAPFMILAVNGYGMSPMNVRHARARRAAKVDATTRKACVLSPIVSSRAEVAESSLTSIDSSA